MLKPQKIASKSLRNYVENKKKIILGIWWYRIINYWYCFMDKSKYFTLTSSNWKQMQSHRSTEIQSRKLPRILDYNPEEDIYLYDHYNKLNVRKDFMKTLETLEKLKDSSSKR